MTAQSGTLVAVEPSRVDRADKALASLVRRRTLTAAQAYAVKEALAAVLAEPDPPQGPAMTPGRGSWAEVVGYLGGALVTAAAALFVVQNYGQLSEAEMAVWQGVAAGVLLAAAALLATVTPGGAATLRQREPDTHVRRRLASTLATLAAAAAAGSASFAAPPDTSTLWAGVAATAVAGLGYALMPSAVGLFGLWVGTVIAVVGVPDAVATLPSPLAYGLLVLGVGLAWAVVALLGLPHESDIALRLGLATALAGAQATSGEGLEWAYGTTTVLAVVGFALYARLRLWPLLAVGVIGVTLAVPEALTDLTDYQLGVVGGLLAAGVSLLAAAGLGLRIRTAAVRRGG